MTANTNRQNEKLFNVSVRLDEEHYNLLSHLQEKYNKVSYSKVAFSDVLRIALRELYALELKNDSQALAGTHKEQLEEFSQAEKETAVSKEIKDSKKLPIKSRS